MTDPLGGRSGDLGSSLGDQDVFIRRHGRTFTIVITLVSAVAAVPLAVALFLLSSVVDDDGARLGMRVASVAMLGVPVCFWGLSKLIIGIRSGWRR